MLTVTVACILCTILSYSLNYVSYILGWYYPEAWICFEDWRGENQDDKDVEERVLGRVYLPIRLTVSGRIVAPSAGVCGGARPQTLFLKF